MYDILFKCLFCGSHLSAEDSDVGISLPCPACEKGIVIPTGDVMFACTECGKDLLASKDCRGDEFHCSFCGLVIVIPTVGKIIEMRERREPASLTAAPERPRDNVTIEAALPASESRITTTGQRQEDNFMITWGDYLATAGLTDTEKKSPKKR